MISRRQTRRNLPFLFRRRRILKLIQRARMSMTSFLYVSSSYPRHQRSWFLCCWQPDYYVHAPTAFPSHNFDRITTSSLHLFIINPIKPPASQINPTSQPAFQSSSPSPFKIHFPSTTASFMTASSNCFIMPFILSKLKTWEKRWMGFNSHGGLGCRAGKVWANAVE